MDFKEFYNSIIVSDASSPAYEAGDLDTRRIVTSYNWVEAEAVYLTRVYEDEEVFVDEYSCIKYDWKIWNNETQVGAHELICSIYRLLTEWQPWDDRELVGQS